MTEQSLDNGKVMKQVLKEGNGNIPKAGAKVRVHYVGTLLNGEEFDSSRRRGQPLEFVLGSGGVIKGWEVAAATMRVGERAMVTIQPDYAYGARGFPPVIPANSVLKFDMELVSAQ